MTPFSMKLSKTVCVLLLSTSAIWATDFSEQVTKLKSTDYNQQTDARNALKFAFADAEGAEYAELQTAIIAQAKSRDLAIEHRLFMIRLLEWFGSPESVPALVELLNEKDAKISDSALRALAAMEGNEASFAIGNGLKNASPAMAAAYMNALAYRKEARAVPMLSAYLKSREETEVAAAAVALMKIGSDDALNSLMDAWKGSDKAHPEIERAILSLNVDATTAMTMFEESTNPGVRIQAFLQLIELDSEKAKTVFQSALDGEASAGRSQILHFGIVNGDDATRELAVNALSSASVPDQILIVTAIGEANLTNAESAVRAVLAGAQDRILRIRCIHTLGNIGSDASFEAMNAALIDDSNNQVILSAIGRLNAPSADKKAVTVVRDSTKPVDERIAAMRIMELRNSPGALDTLHEIAADADAEPKLQDAVFKTLETLGNFRTVEIFVQHINDGGAASRSSQRSLKRLSINLRAPDAVWSGYFEPAIENAADSEVRKRFIAILDGVDSKQAVDYLKQNIIDEDPELGAPSLKSLSRWSNITSMPAWVEIAEASPAKRETSIKQIKRTVTLTDIPGHKRVEALVDAVKISPDPEFKLAILELLSPPPEGTRGFIESRFRKIKDDPDVAERVKEMIDAL